MTGHEVISGPPAPRELPALLLATGPSEADVALLVVALTATLRSRGVRVGTAEARAGIEGAPAVVLTTGAGARVPLPDLPSADAIRFRARAIDPALELILATGLDAPDVPKVIVGAERGATSMPGALAIIHPAEVRRALEDPARALAVTEVVATIEVALLGSPRASTPIERASEAPIESERRLLERADLPPSPQSRGWRRWFGG